MTAPAPTVSSELGALLRRVKLGKCLDTLPERLALAKTNSLAHSEFLELVLADEVARRDTTSAALRARNAGLDPTMTMDRWDPRTEGWPASLSRGWAAREARGSQSPQESERVESLVGEAVA